MCSLGLGFVITRIIASPSLRFSAVLSGFEPRGLRGSGSWTAKCDRVYESAVLCLGEISTLFFSTIFFYIVTKSRTAISLNDAE